MYVSKRKLQIVQEKDSAIPCRISLRKLKSDDLHCQVTVAVIADDSKHPMYIRHFYCNCRYAAPLACMSVRADAFFCVFHIGLSLHQSFLNTHSRKCNTFCYSLTPNAGICTKRFCKILQNSLMKSTLLSSNFTWFVTVHRPVHCTLYLCLSA